MVLHNSKWDRKATQRYNKKHGISNLKIEDNSKPLHKWRKEDQFDIDDDDDRSIDPSKEGETPLENSQDLEEVNLRNGSDELLSEHSELDSQEDILNRQLNLDETVDDSLGLFPVLDDDKEYRELVELSKKLIIKQEEEQATNKGSVNDTRDNGGKIVVQDDIDEYYNLQKDIEHSKLVSTIKNKFGRKNIKNSNTVTDSKEQGFDEFLDEIDGGASASIGDQKNSDKSNNNLGTSTEGMKLDSTKEEWLDGLLGS